MGIIADVRRKYRDEGTTGLAKSTWRNMLRRTPVGEVAQSVLGEMRVEQLVMAPRVGYWPQIHEPRSFNEKVMHRKLFSDDSRFATVSDKHAVRDYVREQVGNEMLTDLHHVGDDPDAIPFDDLPDEYVVKPGNKTAILIDEDGPPQDEIREQCREALSESYGIEIGEWWYADADSQILVEERLYGSKQNVPFDYKFFVFDGEVACIQADHGRFSEHTRRLYDAEWTPLNVVYMYPLAPEIEQPEQLDEMVRVAEQLGKGFDFVRVDLYDTKNKGIVFGEMTLAPESGGGRFVPQQFDFELGSHWSNATY